MTLLATRQHNSPLKLFMLVEVTWPGECAFICCDLIEGR